MSAHHNELGGVLGAASAPPHGDLLVTGLDILTGDGGMLQSGALAIRGGRLADVGTAATVVPKHRSLPAYDGSGYTAMPGLINAHTHAPMGFFRGLGHGHTDMIETFLFPAEKALTAELTEPLSYSYLYGGLKAGVTCFGDHYYYVDGVGRALDRLGLRGVIGETVADLGGAFPGLAGWDTWRRHIDRWPLSPRVRPTIAPHAADTVSAPLLKELAAFAKARGLPLHMHLAQTAGERRRVEAREGCSPVAYAERCGALTPHTLAVHLVAVGQEDVNRLAATGVTAGICPASQIIYEHLAPIAALLAAGVPLAVATDCAASNDGADLLAELRLMSLLAQDRGVPAAARSPAAILAMGTLNAARVLGMEHEIGSLTAGKAADVVFLQGDLGTRPAPRPDVNLLFSMSARNVRHVMVEGRFVLYQGEPTLANPADLSREYQVAVGRLKVP